MDRRIRSVLDSVNVLLTADVQAAARLANLSVPHFRYLFRQHTGTPYASWIRHQRLDTAMQLLSQTSLTIPQICHRIGIQDTSHFIRSFKRRYGSTPALHRTKSSTSN